MVDILIRGGTVVTATDTFEADVGITGERIVAVGDGDEDERCRDGRRRH